MQDLKQPAPELVARVISELDYEHRLVGFRYRPRHGGIPADLYSVRDVVRLLGDKYPAIELDRLHQWLREAIGDEELADRVGEVLSQPLSDREKLSGTRSLLEQRLGQCQSLCNK